MAEFSKLITMTLTGEDEEPGLLAPPPLFFQATRQTCEDKQPHNKSVPTHPIYIFKC